MPQDMLRALRELRLPWPGVERAIVDAATTVDPALGRYAVAIAASTVGSLLLCALCALCACARTQCKLARARSLLNDIEAATRVATFDAQLQEAKQMKDGQLVEVPLRPYNPKPPQPPGPARGPARQKFKTRGGGGGGSMMMV